VLSGLIEIQTKLETLQEENMDIHDGEGSYACGAMVVLPPQGNTLRVEAFRNDLPVQDVSGNDDQPSCECIVKYTLNSVEYVKGYADDWVRAGGRMTLNDGTINQMLPVPSGVFGMFREELWAYPATLSPWKLRVVWTGIKMNYAPGDEVTLTESQFDVLKWYVMSMGAIVDKCWDDAKALKVIYLDELRKECLREWEQQHPRRNIHPNPNPAPLAGWLAPCCKGEPEAYVEPVPQP
jgi:hypothetical protein